MPRGSRCRRSSSGRFRSQASWPRTASSIAATGTLYDPDELRYEWEAVGLLLFRLGVFLLAAGYIRLVVLYARAALGQGIPNPFTALMRGLGFVLGRPARTLSLEVLFGALGLLPLLVWLLVGPVWDGRELGGSP